MNSGLKLGLLTPTGSPPGTTGCINAVFGDAIIQVLDEVTGADVTSSFDAVIPVSGTVVQLDATPAAHNHIVLLQSPGSDPVDVRLALITSLGSAGGTTGTVVAAGVQAGDVVIKAYFPLSQLTLAAAVDCTSCFAPTAPASGDLTQINGIGTGFTTVVLLRRVGKSSTDMMIGTFQGMSPGQTALPVAVSGSRVCSAVQVDGVDRTTEYGGYASRAGFVDQTSGTTNVNWRVLFLLEQPD